METLEYTTIDKSEWGEGQWQSEPDKRQWQSEPDKRQWMDEETGLPCLIVRGPSGALCGYVGVPRSHPDFGKDYNDVNAAAHGGLTYASPCMEGEPESTGICHTVSSEEDDDVWWFGFDCAHSGDYCPSYSRLGEAFARSPYETYKDMRYVERQTMALARRLKALSTPSPVGQEPDNE